MKKTILILSVFAGVFCLQGILSAGNPLRSAVLSESVEPDVRKSKLLITDAIIGQPVLKDDSLNYNPGISIVPGCDDWAPRPRVEDLREALKAFGSNALQDVLNEYAGEKGATVIHTAVEDYLYGSGTAAGSAEKALNSAIDEYVRDPDSNAVLKEAYRNLKEEKSVDYKKVSTTLAKHEADKLIDDSGLSANQKKLAHAAVAELAGEDGALLSGGGDYIQAKLIKEGIPEESAKSIAGKVVGFLSDANRSSDLKDAASELTQELVTKHVGSKGATTINSAIQEYLSAEGTAKSAAETALNTALDQYVRDPASNAALKKAIEDIRNDKTPDYQSVGTALAKHGADKLIDNSGLSANEKALAHAAVAELAGEDGALLDATASHIQKKLIKAGVSEEKAKSISGNIQQYLADTGNTAAIKAAASDSLQELVTKCVDKKGAATINSAIQEYMSAEGSAKSAAVAALDTAIDQYVRDPASNAALKESLANLQEGKSVNYQKVGTALAKHGADKLIDESGLSANEKALAHAAVAEFTGEDGALLNATRDHIQKKLVKAGFPEDKANEISGNIYAFMNDTRNTTALKQAASDSAQQLVTQYVGGKGAATINSAIQEYMSADGTAKSAAETALNTAIDQYVRDPASNAALKRAFSDLKEGRPVDYENTATTLARHGADKWIDNSNLSANEKVLAHAVVAELAGEDGALINATADHVRAKLVKAGVSEETADKIAGNIQQYLADTGNSEALKSIASDAAQAVVSKYVGKDGAEVINSAIQEYMSENGTVGSAAEAALDIAIDKYVKGDDAKKALKEAIEKSKNGESVDYGQVGSTMFTSYALDAIEKSKMSPEEKEAARKAILSLKGEVPWSESGAEVLEAVLIKAGVSKENAEQMSKSIVDFMTGDGDIKSIADNALTIFSSKVADAIDKQLEKWEKKFPFLKEVYSAIGISREDVVNFFKNISVDKIKNVFKQISNMSLDDWKKIGKQLAEKVINAAMKKIAKVLKKLTDKLLNLLKKKVEKLLNKIDFLHKYMDYVNKAVNVAFDKLSGSIKTFIDTETKKAGDMLNSLINQSGRGQRSGN